MNNFRLILDSGAGIKNNVDSSGNPIDNDITFSYNFSSHKKGIYEVTFNFIGTDGNSFHTQPSFPLEIHIEGLNIINTKEGTNYNGGRSYNLLGLCYPKITNNIYDSTTNTKEVTGFMFADINTNPPVYVNLPCNNQITVRELLYNGTYWVDSDDVSCSYTMILNFKYIDCD